MLILNQIPERYFICGRGTANRITSKTHRSKHWLNIVSKYGIEYKKLIEGITVDEANKLEKEYISHYKRKVDGGTLCNLTNGGDGLCGYVPTQEARSKQSKAIKGRIFKVVDEKVLLSEYMTGLTIKELARKYNLCPSKIGKHLSKDIKRKMRAEKLAKVAVKFTPGFTPWNKGLNTGIGTENNFYGKTHSEASKLKMSNKKGKPLFCTNNQTQYRSTEEAAKQLNLYQASVAKVARGYQKQTQGFLFYYL